MSAKTERIEFRTDSALKVKIEEASKAEGTSLTDFVRRHTLQAAEEVLADRRTFVLTDNRWHVFLDALDGPPVERPRLRKLLETPTVLDS